MKGEEGGQHQLTGQRHYISGPRRGAQVDVLVGARCGRSGWCERCRVQRWRDRRKVRRSGHGGRGGGGQVRRKLFEAIPDEDGEKIADHITKVSGKYINKGLDHLRKIIPLWSAGKKTRKKAAEQLMQWQSMKVWGKFLLSCVGEATALAQDIEEMTGVIGKTNNVSVTADHNISLDADHAVKLTGTKVAINGFASAQMTGTIKASLNSYGKASVYGAFGTSIKAMAGDLELESDYKEVKIAAKKNVAIASESEHVFITGEEDVRVNSVKGTATLHGKEGFYAGYAGGVSFGVVGKEKELTVGQHSGCGDPKSVKGKTDGALIAFKQGVVDMMVSEDSIVKIRKTKIEAKTKTLDIQAKSAKINGDRILLG